MENDYKKLTRSNLVRIVRIYLLGNRSIFHYGCYYT